MVLLFLHFIVRTPPLFLITSPGGGNLKNEKKEWKYGAGAGLLKRGPDIFPI